MQGRSFIGILLMLLGAGFLLDKLEIIQFSTLLSVYWPVFLVLIGANHFFSKGHSPVSGTALLLVGIYFLFKNLNLLPEDLGKYFWPVLLIIIGIVIMFGKTKHEGAPAFDDDTVNHFVVFSSLDGKSISQNFKGGRATAIFGGIDLDFRDAKLSEEDVFLDLTATFGGINIKVPEDWKVIIKGTPIFGGWEDKTNSRNNKDESQPTLNIRCLALFGGMEVSN